MEHSEISSVVERNAGNHGGGHKILAVTWWKPFVTVGFVQIVIFSIVVWCVGNAESKTESL